MPESFGPYSVLQNQYILQNTIGAGGFAKVKAAIHCLTGEMVAIKIMDKRALGDDLFRVETEITALKDLCHQNICRLLQIIQTPKHIFLVLEYCDGGELFDHIVRRDRLPEGEARYFFRQILCAVAFVHSKHYAHRDLKPENILINEHNQIKLIDFGLCAKPRQNEGRIAILETCCGSPAYAAPELISGHSYLGSQVDIWSLGVLLFTLLCGFLPFEDDNLRVMYEKIQKGVYEEPSWLSTESKNILKSMLNVDPLKRVGINELMEHSWVTKGFSQPLKWKSIYEGDFVDLECASILADYNEMSLKSMIYNLQQANFDYTTATYLLLLNRKRKRLTLELKDGDHKFNKLSATPHSPAQKLLLSPTIHASLEDGIDRTCYDQNDLHLTEQHPAVDFTDDDSDDDLKEINELWDGRLKKMLSYSEAIHSSQQEKQLEHVSHLVTPRLPRNCAARQYVNDNKENLMPVEKEVQNVTKSEQRHKELTPLRPAATVKETSHQHTSYSWQEEGQRPKSLHNRIDDHQAQIDDCIPLRPKTNFTTPRQTPITPFGQHLRENLNGSYSRRSRSPEKSSNRHRRQRDDDAAKNNNVPHVTNIGSGRKMFTSLERGFDRIKKAMTPNKKQAAAHAKYTPRTVDKNVQNVSCTSSRDPQLVINKLIRVIEEKGIKCNQKGFIIRGKSKDPWGRVQLFLELEVVYIEHMDTIGVRRKRLQGDAYFYKKICEDVLSLANL